MVDYLRFLYGSTSSTVFTHTSNERIAFHFEDILNMMVGELYFEQHMKENDIDVLQFINAKSIGDLPSIEEKLSVVKDFYMWYQKPENPIRQRMQLAENRSKDIIAVINKSILS